MKKTRVAIITVENPEDRKVWSGIPHFIYKSMQKDFDEVVVLGPYRPRNFRLRLLNSVSYRFFSSFSSVSKKLLKKRYNFEYSFVASKLYAAYFEQQLQKYGPFDLIIAPASPAAVAFLKTEVPIFNINDATYRLLSDYYPYISNLLSFSKSESYTIEKLALQNATYDIYSSAWAMNSAVTDYAINPAKVCVIPFGANLESAPSRASVVKNGFTYNLLFLGVDWTRKGGTIAYDCFIALLNMGLDVHLTICGCTPPPEYQHPKMRTIHFLDKNDPVQYKELEDLLKTSDFLLLPTRADCTPVVFCEAGAYAVPTITTDTGGVEGVIKNGVNGFRLPFDAPGYAYAKVIAELYADEQAYLALSNSSRDEYEAELNWAAWSNKIKELYLSLNN